ncbi:MAG: ABC transporter ATP-binding protein [Bacteroidota bacterium]
MKTVFRVLSYLSDFKLLLFLSITLNTMFSVLSTVTIIVIQPVLEALFNPESMNSHPLLSNNESISVAIKQWFFTTVLDIVQSDSHSTTLLHLGLLILFLFILKNLTKYLGNNVNVRLGEGISKSIRDQLFRKMMSLSMDYFNRSKVGDNISFITNSVATMNGAVSPIFLTVFRQPIEIALFLAVLFSYSPFLTMIAFSTSIGSLLIIKLSTKAIKMYASRMLFSMHALTSLIQEMISGIRLVKTTASEDKATHQFEQETQRYVKASVKNQKLVDLVPVLNEILAISALCAVLYVGGNQVYDKELKPQELMTFLFALFSIMSPIAQLTNTPAVIQKGIVAAETVFDIIDQQPTVKNGNTSIHTFTSSITVDNLHFSYDGNHEVLHDINLNIDKGKTIALVGQSGSGKSTMSDLIVRLYDPNKGSICIDGININEFSIEEYRQLFGIVSQDSFLFNDTIAENICFGKNIISEDEMIYAAKMANAHDFIISLPMGYQTKIGDRGVLLSGGQKQRLAIARALVRKPQILIFDEATSALDAESEHLVQEAIHSLLHGRTALIIAHRLSTIIDADCIYVFDNGSIAESGTHKELLEKGGIYFRLCSLQTIDIQ